MRTHLVLALVSLSASLCAQRVLFQHHGPPRGTLGQVVRPAGDVDGDGVRDFVATQPEDTRPSRVEVVSGRTGVVIWVLPAPQLPSTASLLDAVGIGDVDGDARSDIAVATYVDLQLFSGMTGLQLYARPPGTGLTYLGVCEVGDWNGDNRADLAAVTYNNGRNHVHVLDGRNGGLFASIPDIINNNAAATLRPVGDITGDNRTELLLGLRAQVHVLSSQQLASIRMLTSTHNPNDDFGGILETLDIDGDGLREVAVGRYQTPATTRSQGRVEVYDVVNGNLRGVFEMPFGYPGIVGRTLAPLGDLNQDGSADLSVGAGGEDVIVVSTRTWKPLWHMTQPPAFPGFGLSMTGLGDVDGDGFHDLAVGAPGDSPFGGGWLVVSGRILADVQWLGGACGGGPFLVELGATRPILGQNTTIVCRDGTPGAWGTLALSLRPTYPTYLGASTCTAHFDIGNWVILLGTSAPQWSLMVPVPNAPQLAGLELALQAFYSPTGGPLGLDLSNGVAARIGW